MNIRKKTALLAQVVTIFVTTFESVTAVWDGYDCEDSNNCLWACDPSFKKCTDGSAGKYCIGQLECVLACDTSTKTCTSGFHTHYCETSSQCTYACDPKVLNDPSDNECTAGYPGDYCTTNEHCQVSACDTVNKKCLPRSKAPSMSPSSLSSQSPTCHPSSTAHACGDPHFKTFDDQLFSYHGQCDLLLTRSDSFAHGLGLHVHIRTTRVSSPHMDYSYISGIAVKIGPDTLEVSGDGKLIVNGHSTVFPEFTDKIAFAGTVYTLTKTIMGTKQRIVAYNLDLGEDIDSSIQIRVNTKKSMLFVDMNGAFADSEGLLGAAAEEGKPLFARDGVTDLTGHWNTYGEEWQVNDTDLKLFQDSNRHPQYPQGCLYTTMDNDNKEATTTMAHVRRRLEDTGVTQHIVGLQEASKACSHLDHDERMKNFCVNDVMATGDLDLVEDPFYAHA